MPAPTMPPPMTTRSKTRSRRAARRDIGHPSCELAPHRLRTASGRIAATRRRQTGSGRADSPLASVAEETGFGVRVEQAVLREQRVITSAGRIRTGPSEIVCDRLSQVTRNLRGARRVVRRIVGGDAIDRPTPRSRASAQRAADVRRRRIERGRPRTPRRTAGRSSRARSSRGRSSVSPSASASVNSAGSPISSAASASVSMRSRSGGASAERRLDLEPRGAQQPHAGSRTCASWCRARSCGSSPIGLRREHRDRIDGIASTRWRCAGTMK